MDPDRLGALISASRSVLYPSSGRDAGDWRQAIRARLESFLLDLACSFIRRFTAAWYPECGRRIAFSMCVSNVDDHLRNHGFLLCPGGWVLAPAYDMNPVATGNGLSLNVSEADNSQDLGLAREVAIHFRLKPKRANEIITEVTTAVSMWQSEAKRAGIPRDEQLRMASAFRLAETSR